MSDAEEGNPALTECPIDGRIEQPRPVDGRQASPPAGPARLLNRGESFGGSVTDEDDSSHLGSLVVPKGQQLWLASEVPALTARALWPEWVLDGRPALALLSTARGRGSRADLTASEYQVALVVWRGLGMPDPDDVMSPRRWAPYVEAFNATRPEGWGIRLLLPPGADLLLLTVEQNHTALLRRAIEAGEVAAVDARRVAASPLTPLDQCFLTRSELAKFCELAHVRVVYQSGAPAPIRPPVQHDRSQPLSWEICSLPQIPAPDWNKWRELARCDLWCFVALSLNMEPSALPTYFGYDTPFKICPETFRIRLSTAISHADVTMPQQVFPDGHPGQNVVLTSAFRSLAQRLGWTLPEQFPGDTSSVALVALATERPADTTGDSEIQPHPPAEALPKLTEGHPSSLGLVRQVARGRRDVLVPIMEDVSNADDSVDRAWVRLVELASAPAPRYPLKGFSGTEVLWNGGRAGKPKHLDREAFGKRWKTIKAKPESGG